MANDRQHIIRGTVWDGSKYVDCEFAVSDEEHAKIIGGTGTSFSIAEPATDAAKPERGDTLSDELVPDSWREPGADKRQILDGYKYTRWVFKGKAVWFCTGRKE